MDDKNRDADLNTAMALTQRLLGSSGDDASRPSPPAAKPSLSQNLRYWLWQAGGRKRSQTRTSGQIAKLLDNYEIELERLRQTHGRDLAMEKQAHDRIIKEIEAAHQQSIGSMRAAILAEAEAASEQVRQELTRERQRVAQLEQLAAEFERVYKAELAKAQERGEAQGQTALDAAQDRITALEEELAAQQSRHHEQLRRQSEEAAKAAETGMTVLRDEIKALRASQAEELALSRRLYQEQAESELETLHQQVAAAELDKETALRQAQQQHDTTLAALRTRHAEELAETRISGEWSLGDAKRQIADLRLRLTEQDEAHAEDMQALHDQHRGELGLWLEKFEHGSQALKEAQAHIAELTLALEQARLALAANGDHLNKAQVREEALTEQLAAERTARQQAETAEKLAGERVQQLQAALDGERRNAQDQGEKLPDVAAVMAEHTLELARLRLDSSRRIAELERQLAQGQTPPPTESIAPAKTGIDWEARAQDALERAMRAEAEAQLAANKIEVLKDALALAKARPVNGNAPAIDHRFRDAKRAFARAFHPDQGGREHPDKADLFLEFWPVLEKIDKDDF